MEVYLLYENQEADLYSALPWNEKDLINDLELKILFDNMASEDEFVFDVVRKTIFSGLKNDTATMIYRQEILKDCLRNTTVIRALYDLIVEAINNREHSWYSVFSTYPSSILSGSIGMLGVYLGYLKRLRVIAGENIEKFKSPGFGRFFAMIQTELTDEYLDEIQQHLNTLKNSRGILINYQLGKGNNGIAPQLRKIKVHQKNWIQKLFPHKSKHYSFEINPRDEGGINALKQITDNGINSVANVLAQSNDHILQFFNMVRTELAFYKGCLNLYEQLKEINEPVCFPIPLSSSEREQSFSQLFDVCLALKMKTKIVGNDLDAHHKSLYIITGANQGGKSTFLRSIGIAQLMMQAGMFVPAQSFSVSICNGLYSHFKKEEDRSMKSGKFDEELRRMNDIVNHIKPDSLLLFNESFAATNDREGSEIARQIVSALVEKGFKVFFVTHLFEFALGFFNTEKERAVFLRAERKEDATRTFRLVEGEPLQTSYGIDVYNKIFGVS